MSTEKDIEIIYPSQSIITDSLDIIHSKDFSELIYKESHATAYKAHDFHIETRDVPNNNLISKWLFAVLVSNKNVNVNDYPLKITKKYRYIVIFSNDEVFRRSDWF